MDIKLSDNANQSDTISHMLRIAKRDSKLPMARAFAKVYKHDPQYAYKVAKMVFFGAPYKPDKKKKQGIRTLKRLFKDSHANCVDYATAISTLLLAAGIRHSFRAVNIDGDSIHHIYIVTDSGLVLDPVIGQEQKGREKYRRNRKPQIGQEVSYVQKFDFLVK